jgi:hypothetical protein
VVGISFSDVPSAYVVAPQQTADDVATHKRYRERIYAADWDVSTPADRDLEHAAQEAEARLRAKGLDRDGNPLRGDQ